MGPEKVPDYSVETWALPWPLASNLITEVSVKHSYRLPQDRQDGDSLDSQVLLWLLLVHRPQYKSCLLRETSGRTTVAEKYLRRKNASSGHPQQRASSASL